MKMSKPRVVAKRISKKIVGGFFLAAIFLEGVAFAGQSPFIELPLSARIDIRAASQEGESTQFDQRARIILPIDVGLDRIRSMATNGALIAEISDWVTNAEFKPLTTSPYMSEFWLSIGKMGLEYTHAFDCEDKVEDSSWRQSCLEIEGRPAGKKILLNGRRSFSCDVVKTVRDDVIHCELRMTGETSDLNAMIKTIRGQKVAYILFLESAAYLAQLGMLLAGQAESVAEAKNIFSKSPGYKKLFEELQGVAPDKKLSSLRPGEELSARASTNNYAVFAHFAEILKSGFASAGD